MKYYHIFLDRIFDTMLDYYNNLETETCFYILKRVPLFSIIQYAMTLE